MAMSVRKDWADKPPPIGTARVSKKAKKAKLKAVTKQSVMDQIRSIPKGQDLVVDMTAVRAAIEAAKPQVMQEEDPPFAPQSDPAVSSGGSGQGGGDKEWYPTWQFNDEPAWYNLVQNMLLMKPLGRKFNPDPDYNGKGECPLPQRTALFSEIRYNNVIPFEDAVASAKDEAIKKRDNSARSRGGDLFNPVLREYPGYEKNQGQPKIPEPPAPSPAFQRVKAANEERDPSWDPAFEQEESMSTSGNTEELYDIHLQALWYYPVTVATQLHFEGFAKISPSYDAWYQGDEIHIGRVVSEKYNAVYRIDEMDFYSLLEIRCDMLVPEDMVSTTQLSDQAVEAIFMGIPSLNTNQFLTWDEAELDRLHHMVETSRRNMAAIDPMKKTFFNDPATIFDLQRWEEEHREGLERLGFTKVDPEVEAESLEVSPCDRHRAYLGTMIKQYSPWVAANENPSPYAARWRQLYSKKMERLLRQDEHAYQAWLFEHYDPTCTRDGITTAATYERQTLFFDSVPRIMTRTEEGNSITRAVKSVTRKASRLWNRFNQWLDEPIYTFGGEEEEVAPAPKPTDEEVVLASKAIYKKIVKESMIEVDNRETIEWLQEKDRPIEEASSPEFVNRVMHVIQDGKQEDLYSATGIYLGKKTRFEQVNEGQNVLLLNAKVPPKIA